MLKAILFFTLILPSIFSFANHITKAAATPKPITLTFFELTNKLTAKHKKQLNSAMVFLKRNKGYELHVFGGTGIDGTNKSERVSSKRIDNILSYIEKTNKNYRISPYASFGNQFEHHIVKIFIFKKMSFDSLKLDFNNDGILEFDYSLEMNCNLTNQAKYQLDQLAAYCLKNPLVTIQIKAGTTYSYRSQTRADCRNMAIKNYLFLLKKVDIKRIEILKDQDIFDHLVEINVIKE